MDVGMDDGHPSEIEKKKGPVKWSSPQRNMLRISQGKQGSKLKAQSKNPKANGGEWWGRLGM